jgi:hypothetical protein
LDGEVYRFYLIGPKYLNVACSTLVKFVFMEIDGDAFGKKELLSEPWGDANQIAVLTLTVTSP